MKNVNYSLVNENESSVFANLVTGATGKTLDAVTFLEKETETTISVKYDIETLPSFKELQNFGIEIFAYCSKVGSGKKTFILAQRKSDNLTVFADIETLRKSFGISYNIKVSNLTDLQIIAKNLAIANGLEYEISEESNKVVLTISGDFSIFAKAEKAQTTKQQLEAERQKTANLEAELLALKKQLGLI